MDQDDAQSLDQLIEQFFSDTIVRGWKTAFVVRA
jgi:hypothetical protein